MSLGYSPTPNQVPDKSILDSYGRQTYLGQEFSGSTPVVGLANTNETPLLYLLNPLTPGSSVAGAGQKALFCWIRKYNNADAANLVTFKLYSNPTGVSGGTTVTPFNLRPASTTTSIATCKYSPTTATNGTYITASTIYYAYFQIESTILLILDPGQSTLVTATANAGTPNVIVQFVWTEQ